MLKEKERRSFALPRVLHKHDLDYMVEIYNANMDTRKKAKKLSEYCDLSTLKNNMFYYSRDNKEIADLIEKFIDIYVEYEKMGYIEKRISKYKCTLHELLIRVEKLKEASLIFSSDKSDYHKVASLLKLYDSSNDFKNQYSLLIKNGKNDSRLAPVRASLDDFDNLYKKFKTYEDLNIVHDVIYLEKIKSYFANYSYAKFVLEYYVSSKLYKESEICAELGIDRDSFSFCLAVIEELDVDLYNKYLKKKEINKKIRFVRISHTLTDLTNGIKTGFLSDGTPFDLLEFMKRVPFKSSENFMEDLMRFMININPTEMDIIMNYIYKNKIDFKPLNLAKINRTKTIIKNVEITEEDNLVILDYLTVNGIPATEKTFALARKKFVEKAFSKESVQIEKDKLKQGSEFKKTLIP